MKQITELKKEDSYHHLILLLFQQAKKLWPPDGKMRHWEGVVKYQRVNYVVKIDMQWTTHNFTFDNLKIERESQIIIH